MIVIGIPTLNEADNISSLVKKIDAAAQLLGLDIVFINSDNNSKDKTSDVFLSTETAYPKYSYLCDKIGKGNNIRIIF